MPARVTVTPPTPMVDNADSLPCTKDAVALNGIEEVVWPLKVKVKVPLDPVTVTVWGPASPMSGVAGLGVIGTPTELLDPQPAAFVTVRPSVTLPEANAV